MWSQMNHTVCQAPLLEACRKDFSWYITKRCDCNTEIRFRKKPRELCVSTFRMHFSHSLFSLHCLRSKIKGRAVLTSRRTTQSDAVKSNERPFTTGWCVQVHTPFSPTLKSGTLHLPVRPWMSINLSGRNRACDRYVHSCFAIFCYALSWMMQNSL